MGSFDIESVFKKQNRRERATEAVVLGTQLILEKLFDIKNVFAKPESFGKAKARVSEDETRIMYLPRGIFGEGEVIQVYEFDTEHGESSQVKFSVDGQPSHSIIQEVDTTEVE